MFSRLVSRGSSIAGPLPRRIVNFESKVPLMSVSTKPTVAYPGCSQVPAVLRPNPYVNTQPTRCFVTSIPANYSESIVLIKIFQKI